MELRAPQLHSVIEILQSVEANNEHNGTTEEVVSTVYFVPISCPFPLYITRHP